MELTHPVSDEEKYGLVVKTLNVRQFLGIDIYEAKGIVKISPTITCLQDFHQYFSHERIRGRIPHFKNDLRKAVFSAERVDKILTLLSQLDECVGFLSRASPKDIAIRRSSISPTKRNSISPTKRNSISTTKLNQSDRRSSRQNATKEPQALTLSHQASDNNNIQQQKRKNKGHDAETKVEKSNKVHLKPLQSSDNDNCPQDDKMTMQEHYLQQCAYQQILPHPKLFSKMNQSSVDVQNFNLGTHGSLALINSFSKNSNLTSLNLSQNCIKHIGGLQLVKSLPALSTALVHLNLMDNQIGTQASILICESFINNQILRTLNLQGNGIEDRIAKVIKVFLKTSKVTELYLGHNRLRDITAQRIGQALSCYDIGLDSSLSSLKKLDLTWNSIAPDGAKALAQGLCRNTSLQTLCIGWNALQDDGGLAFAICLLHNQTLKVLNLASNRISGHVIGFMPDILHFNTSLIELDLTENHGPLFDMKGWPKLLEFKARYGEACHIHLPPAQKPTHRCAHYGTTQDTISSDHDRTHHVFDPTTNETLNGVYRLNLSNITDLLIAHLLFIRNGLLIGSLTHISLDSQSMIISDAIDIITNSTPMFSLPSQVLKMEYVAQPAVPAQPLAPSIHFQLNLDDVWQSSVFNHIFSNHKQTVDAKWVNMEWNGSSVNDPMHSLKALLEQKSLELQSAVERNIEFDYFALDKLKYERHYQLDFAVPRERNLARKLLMEKSTSKEEVEHEVRNATFNDKRPFDFIKEWATENAVKKEKQESNELRWDNLPLSGVFEFDIVVSKAKCIDVEHYRFDLSMSKHRRSIYDLSHRLTMNDGEYWWNEHLNHIPIHFPRIQNHVNTLNYRVPRRGLLELDVVLLRPSSQLGIVSLECRLDLSILKEYMEAEILRLLCCKYPQEFHWFHVELNETFFTAHREKILPSHSGVLEFRMYWFPLSSTSLGTTTAQSDVIHHQLLEQMELCGLDNSRKLNLLHAYVKEYLALGLKSTNASEAERAAGDISTPAPPQLPLNSDMVIQYLGQFEFPMWKRNALEIVFSLVEDKIFLVSHVIKYQATCFTQWLDLDSFSDIKDQFNHRQ